jgi:phosphoribosylformimino-5-aminoimidazole carboxamide ribotide isomerase
MRISFAFKCFAGAGSVRIPFLGNIGYEQTRKTKLKIIPVLDILDGVAVHAIRGVRKQYKPLKSIISVSPDPLEVARAFENLGFTELYVADLDAISGVDCSFSSIRKIVDGSNIRLMVDGGVSDIRRTRELLQIGVSKIIVGTETLTSMDFVEEVIRFLGGERVLLSLDLRNGHLVTNLGSDVPAEPLSLLRRLCEGLTQVILLDLARVGSGEGANTAFLRHLLGDFDLKVYVGGGVGSCEDLSQLKELGATGVLLATALHSGVIRAERLVEVGLEL